jgi:transposase
MAPHLTADKITGIEAAFELHGEPINITAIAKAFKVTYNTVNTRATLWRKKKLLGDKYKAPKPGRKLDISGRLEDDLLDLVEACPFILQDEIADYFDFAHGLSITQQTISNALQRVDITRKKLSIEAAQRDPELRKEWRFTIAGYSALQLVFVDESGSDERTGDRQYGYAKRGKRATVKRWLAKRKRISLCPAYTVEGVLEFITYEGSMTGEMFRDWIIGRLLPRMNPFPQPNSVLIMDNASWHHSHFEEIQAACEARGIRTEWLPPYSPDFNPIEEFFGVLKAFIRRHYRQKIVNYPSYQEFLRWAVYECGSGAKACQNAQGQFYHAKIRDVPGYN